MTILKTVFAFDFDNTISRDPTGFLSIMGMLEERGHEVYVVTARREDVYDDDFELVRAYGFKVIKTRHISKMKWMEEVEGIKVDVWVDDCPDAILNNWHGAPRTYREITNAG